MLSPRRSTILFLSCPFHPILLLSSVFETNGWVGFPPWKLRMHQVDELLARMDIQGSQLDIDPGPFSVFQVSTCYTPANEETKLSRPLDQMETSSSSPLSAQSPPSTPDLSGPENGTPGLPRPFFPSTISIYSRWPLAAKLFHHYATNITDLLRPFLHPGNFYGTVYVPRAILGAESLFSSQSSESWDFPSWSNQSIFYSLLSTAAFHLRGVKTRDHNDQSQRMDNVGRFCRMMAYRHLRTAMAGPIKNIAELQTVMSATLSLITIDVRQQHSTLPIPSQTLSRDRLLKKF